MILIKRIVPHGVALVLMLVLSTHVAADTTVEHSYWERIQDAMSGFIAGCCLLVFAICMLVGTERQAIVYDVLLERCQQATIIINDNMSINSLNENKPVFLTGKTHLETSSSDESDVELGEKEDGAGSSLTNIFDQDTGFLCNTPRLALRLRRRVEMYQWVEHEKKEEKQTTFTYSLEWREHDVPSGHFQESSSHHNPLRSPPLQSRCLSHSSPVKVGAYRLAEQQIDLMKEYVPCSIKPGSVLQQGSRFSRGQHVEQDSSSSSRGGGGGYLVYNGSTSRPQPGTVRVSYQALQEGGDVSTVAVQQQHAAQSTRSGGFRAFAAGDAQALEPWFVTVILRALSGDCSCQRRASFPSENYELEPGDMRGGGGGGESGGCCLPCQVCCCCCAALSSCAGAVSAAVVGDSVLLLQERRTTLGTIFRDERDQLGRRLLLMRLGGCLLLSVALYLIFNPIAVVLSFIPYVSGWLSNGFWVVSLLLGFTLGAMVVALSWIVYRPLYFGALATCVGVFLGPTGWPGGSFLVAGALSLLLALLHAVDSCRYTSALQEERSARPVGTLHVQPMSQQQQQGQHGFSYYQDSASVPATASYYQDPASTGQGAYIRSSASSAGSHAPSAPPLPEAKYMRPMNVQ